MLTDRWFPKLLLALALMVGAVAGSFAYENGAAQLFKQHSTHIYQIRLIDLAAEKKSVLGSGFLVAEPGVLATNYHVVEPAISQPG